MAYLFDGLRRNRTSTAHEVEVLRHILDALGRAMGEQEYRLFHGRNSRTISTTAFTFSTGVSGRMPCPRLKIWPGRPAARRKMSVARDFISSTSLKSSTGSRLP